MKRPRRGSKAKAPARRFRIALRGRALEAVAWMFRTGFYGTTIDETAERLLCERLAEIDAKLRREAKLGP